MIRPVRRSDAAAVNELLDQLGYPQDSQAETADRLQFWTENPTGAAYAAEADGELLGVIAVQVCPFFERAGAQGRIIALVVSDRARRRGVGSRLIEAAESFAAAQGCHRMEVTSSNYRQDAHAFYQRRGYVDQSGRSSRFLRELGPLPAGSDA